MLTILHGSDVHFGKPHVPRAARSFAEAAAALPADVIVVSGDLTQRAKAREYAAARRFLEDLPDVPVIVTPGNHDVPLYRAWERALFPFLNYRSYIDAELDTVTPVRGTTFVALNSAAPRRAVINGRIQRKQLAWAEAQFSKSAPGDLRVAVIHHNLVPAPDGVADAVLPRSGPILSALCAMEVDLLLGGHLHRGFVTEWSPEDAPARALRIVMSGTTSSTRGRVGEIGKQSYNVLRIDGTTIVVERYLSSDAGRSFEIAETRTLPRVREPEHPMMGRSTP